MRCSRFLMCLAAHVALGAILCVPSFARDFQETVTKGSPDVFAQTPSVGAPAPYNATDTTYFIHVPDDYSADRSYALVLALSPGNDGKDMFTPWEKAAEKYGLIFACPNNAGNTVRTDTRGQMALDTLSDVRRKFSVDAEQIYVTGFSGGGRMSTGMVLAFPGLFAGLIPMGGIIFNNDFDAMARLNVKRGVYIFVGETDFNRSESERAKQIAEKAGTPVALMIAPGVEHVKASADQVLEIYEWFLARGGAATK